MDDKKNNQPEKIEEDDEIETESDDDELDEDEAPVLRPVDEDEEIDRFRGRDDREPEKEERKEVERKKRPENADDVLGENLVARVKNANPRLRALLRGLIQVSLKGTSSAYHLDWRSDEAKSGKGSVESPDCTIHLGEKDLLKIVSGDLNPQIAMLSDKIKVEGKSEFAVYFFNLISYQGSRI